MHLQLLSLQEAPNNSAMTSLIRFLYLPGLVGELLWVYLRQDRLSIISDVVQLLHIHCFLEMSWLCKVICLKVEYLR